MLTMGPSQISTPNRFCVRDCHTSPRPPEPYSRQSERPRGGSAPFLARGRGRRVGGAMTLHIHQYMDKLQKRGAFEQPGFRDQRRFNPWSPARRRRALTAAVLALLLTFYILSPQYPQTSPVENSHLSSHEDSGFVNEIDLEDVGGEARWEYSVVEGFFAQSLDSTDDKTFNYVPPIPIKTNPGNIKFRPLE
jgi:hypothetical protein